MNKKIKAIIEFVKVHKKETIGVAVALGVAIVGCSGYAISKHYSNKTKAAETNNIALAEKKEDSSKTLENNEDDPKEEATEIENDIVVEENEDGTLIVKDKEGNTIADSSKGDDITKVIAEKKEAGSNVNIKDKDGKIEKVDKIESGSITVTGGGTVTVKPPVVAEATKPTNKTSNNNAGGNAESNSKPQENNNSNNNPTPPAQNNKPVEQPSVDNNKPQQPVETTKPQPPVEKPTEKPQEPVEPEKPKRTWEYQGAMSQELWSLFNQYRQENGLNALNWSGKYATWTKQHAEEMAQKEDAYHKGYPEGGQVTGLDGSKNMTASKILQGFKNSPQHNKNLLDDELTEGACAVYKDSNGVYYFVIGFDY
ncbi:CAP domain-containing protein [Clostridium perfringens]|uniref:CAP domain-containing protein n=1 Tax=Clostridium perfringens TaxID=1502 RepID=UPI0028CE2DA4|nr:CAP domain-containing protein [Clostridium perfringens]MDT7988952.1 CAP domain-containing protein [Clostridium perfringens]